MEETKRGERKIILITMRTCPVSEWGSDVGGIVAPLTSTSTATLVITQLVFIDSSSSRLHNATAQYHLKNWSGELVGDEGCRSKCF